MSARRIRGAAFIAALALWAVMAATAAAAVPAAPTNVRTSNVTASSITLSWSGVAGATSYGVVLGGYTASTTATSYNFTQLNACTSYTLGVRATSGSGSSAYVNVTVRTTGCPPAAPAGAAVAGISRTSMLLYWKAAAGATSYGVEVGGYTATTTATNYMFTQMNPCTSYTLGVRAVNAAGASTYSTITARTAGCAPAGPAAPTGATVTNVTNSSMTLSWTASSGATSYGTEGGGTTSTTTGTSHTFTALTACTSYTVGVRAVNSAGNSTYTTVTARTAGCGPSAPAGATVTNITSSSMQLSWSAASGATSYGVEVGSYTSTTTGTSYTFTGMSPCTAYTVGVRSVNAAGNSAWVTSTATTAACTTPPATGLHVSGNQLLNASGQLVRLHGVDRAGTEYQCIHGVGIFDGPNMTNDDAQVPLMKQWNINSVFIGLNEDCWLGINGVPSAYSGANYINAIVHEAKTLESQGMYPVIGLFWSAPGTTPATSQAAMPDNDHSPAFWQSVANAFKGDPNVMFRLKEEPYPAGNSDSVAAWQCWSAGDVQYAASGSLTPVSQTSHCSEGYPTVGMQSLVNIIRGTGATNVIQIPGVQYANSMTHFLDSGIRVTDTLSAPQLMADVDLYPNGNICNSTACYTSEYGPVAAVMPFDAGEIGESTSGNDTSTGLVDTALTWFDQHDAGYYAWSWDTWGGSNQLITDYTTGNPYGNWGADYKSHIANLP